MNSTMVGESTDPTGIFEAQKSPCQIGLRHELCKVYEYFYKLLKIK